MIAPLATVVAVVAHAEEPAAAPVELKALPPPAHAPPAAEHVDALTNRAASRLRCPVCQGMSVADSPSKTAVEWKGRIRELVEQGYSEQQIVDFFADRYTDWVLLEPKFADHWAVWVVPGLGLGLGLAFVAATVLSWRRPSQGAAPATHAETTGGDGVTDEYEARLLKELDP